MLKTSFKHFIYNITHIIIYGSVFATSGVQVQTPHWRGIPSTDLTMISSLISEYPQSR